MNLRPDLTPQEFRGALLVPRSRLPHGTGGAPVLPIVIRRPCPSPNGASFDSPGQSPGKPAPSAPALKGRHSFAAHRPGSCAALSGLETRARSNPGLCPGLSNDGLSGLAAPAHRAVPNPFGIGAPIWSAATCRRLFPAGLVPPGRATSRPAKKRRQVAALQIGGERCSALRAGQPGGLREISRGLSAATPPVGVHKFPAPRRGARGARAARRVHGSGIPSECGTPGGVTGGVVALRAPQPPANFWQPSRLRASDFGAFGLNAKAQRRKDAEKAGVGRAPLSSARRGEAWASSATSLRFRRGAVRTPRPTSTGDSQEVSPEARVLNLFPLGVSASLRLCVKILSELNQRRSHETPLQKL